MKDPGWGGDVLTTAKWSRIRSKCLKFLWWEKGSYIPDMETLGTKWKRGGIPFDMDASFLEPKNKSPRRCPHGSHVYGISNFRTRLNLMKSASLLSGQRFRVKQITQACRRHVTTRMWFPRGCCTVARSATSKKRSKQHEV